ncbi:MAG: MBL fold metallo-hydrolase [Bacteroidetes bacterium]|jgi:glyoxylase-like metal-dependent hydrolase (beta-lactamase superfamily II)|nr:MBL fold metallo-hydrolase [Bacteroidota bacterium]
MIKTLDLKFLGKPDTIASFLVETSEGPILFETGPYSTFDNLKAEVERHGHQLADIKHVFVTHIHLDHAGAAWALAELGADIYLHPVGQGHMHDPSKLVASATRIYGDDMERLWSSMKGIPNEQLKPVQHGTTTAIGDTAVKAWHTPGHAVHHIAWQVGEHLIAGDVAGVKIDGGPVVPPCPPPDINVEHWQESIRLLRSLKLDTIHLTHYGGIPAKDIPNHLDLLEQRLLSWAEWMRPQYEQGNDPKEITPVFQAHVQKQLKDAGVEGELLEIYENANPSWMSVAGLLRYWRKKLQA